MDVLVNKASDTDGVDTTTPAKLDWSTFAVTSGIELPDFTATGTGSLALDATLDLYAAGSVSFDALSGIAVGTGSFELALGTVYGADGQGTPVAVGAALKPASAVAVTLSDVDLWVGAGGSLSGTDDNDPATTRTYLNDAVVEGDLGFHGTVASMQRALLKDPKTAELLTDDVSYL